MTVGQFINQSLYLSKNPALAFSFSSQSRRLDTELILSHVLNCPREKLYVKWTNKLNHHVLKKCQCLMEKRSKGWPVSYITGKKEFYGREFYIKQPVFIPRPETETLIQASLSLLDPHGTWFIMDFGCGSGCLGLSLLMEWPSTCLVGADCDKTACQLSQKNAQKFQLTKRSLFLRKNIKDITKNDGYYLASAKPDLIIANPPYIAFNDPKVASEVVHFESPKALFSPNQGFYHIFEWLQKAYELLKPKGHYLFEIGQGQEKSLKKKFSSYTKYWEWKTEFKDLSGHTRIIHLQKNG